MLNNENILRFNYLTINIALESRISLKSRNKEDIKFPKSNEMFSFMFSRNKTENKMLVDIYDYGMV